MIRFPLQTEYIELHQLLKAAGLAASGGEAKIAITSNEVSVDGQIETRKGCKIRRGQKVEYLGETIAVE